MAENYLKKSGIDYTIVRPGGLKAKPPTGALQISGEDTLNSGEISRDLVADVCIASLTDAKASNKVLGKILNSFEINCLLVVCNQFILLKDLCGGQEVVLPSESHSILCYFVHLIVLLNK